MSADTLLDAIIRREGGFVDHPADRGGPTHWGITQATLAAYRGRPVTVDEVRALAEDEAKLIYRVQYVYPFAAVADERLKELVVDAAVNHGVTRAVRWLQAAVGVRDDGELGPISEAALRALGPSESDAVYRAFLRSRIRFYGRLISDDPTQAVFAAGWLNRVADFVV